MFSLNFAAKYPDTPTGSGAQNAATIHRPRCNIHNPGNAVTARKNHFSVELVAAVIARPKWFFLAVTALKNHFSVELVAAVIARPKPRRTKTCQPSRHPPASSTTASNSEIQRQQPYIASEKRLTKPIETSSGQPLWAIDITN